MRRELVEKGLINDIALLMGRAIVVELNRYGNQLHQVATSTEYKWNCILSSL